jgi:hypothetical protein
MILSWMERTGPGEVGKSFIMMEKMRILPEAVMQYPEMQETWVMVPVFARTLRFVPGAAILFLRVPSAPATGRMVMSSGPQGKQ